MSPVVGLFLISTLSIPQDLKGTKIYFFSQLEATRLASASTAFQKSIQYKSIFYLENTVPDSE